MHNAFVVCMDFTLFVVLFLVSESVSSRFLSSINHLTYLVYPRFTFKVRDALFLLF
jgi:hypothetical protein